MFFCIILNNVGNKNVPLVFKGSDMVYDDIKWFVYEKTINVSTDGVKRKLYYNPEKLYEIMYIRRECYIK